MFGFSELTQVILRTTGWFPERQVDPMPWIEEIQQEGYPVFDTAYHILAHLGGLTVTAASSYEYTWVADRQSTPRRYARKPLPLSDGRQVLFVLWPMFAFNPSEAPEFDYEAAELFTNHPLVTRQGLAICPIGTINGLETLFVTSDGRVFKGQFEAPRGYEGRGDESYTSLTLLGNTLGEAINSWVEECVAYL